MDAVDPEKLQATVSEESLNDACDMKRAMEMVALLEAQIKEMNPNLDSIAEYGVIYSLLLLFFFFWFKYSSYCFVKPDIGKRFYYTMHAWMS